MLYACMLDHITVLRTNSCKLIDLIHTCIYMYVSIIECSGIANSCINNFFLVGWGIQATFPNCWWAVSFAGISNVLHPRVC